MKQNLYHIPLTNNINQMDINLRYLKNIYICIFLKIKFNNSKEHQVMKIRCIIKPIQ